MSNTTGATLNNPANVMPDVGGSDWPMPGGALPDQGGGGSREILQPGITTFRLPANLAACWHEIEYTDRRKVLMNGQPNPTHEQKKKALQLKFDKNNPLVVVGGSMDGAPLTMSWSEVPQPRSRWDARDDPSTPWISDLIYFLELGLGDTSRPATPELRKARINQYAGKTIRFEHGLRAECRADKVRWINVVTRTPDPADPTKLVESENLQQDPAGIKGCGKKFYTKLLKNPNEPAGSKTPYYTDISCDGKGPDGNPCLAELRAFETFERFMPPVGS